MPTKFFCNILLAFKSLLSVLFCNIIGIQKVLLRLTGYEGSVAFHNGNLSFVSIGTYLYILM